MPRGKRDDSNLSQAEGLGPVPRPLRLRELPDELRKDIFNALAESIRESIDTDPVCDRKKTVKDPWLRLLELKHAQFDHRPIGEFNPDLDGVVAELKTFILCLPYNRVLDLLQFLARHDARAGSPSPVTGAPGHVVENLNAVFEEHRAAYRFAGTTVRPIATEEEAEVLKKALADLAVEGLGGARAHLSAASEALARRDGAREAVREAVHAVESVGRVLTGNPKATLSDALGVLKKKERVPQALETAFHKLHAYADDEHDLGEALKKEGSDVEGDAMHVLGSCAGFVSYLVGRARKYGLPPFER